MSTRQDFPFEWPGADFVATREQREAIWQALYGGAPPYTLTLPDGRRATFSRYVPGEVFLAVDAEPPPGAPQGRRERRSP